MNLQGVINTIKIFSGIKKAFGLPNAIKYIYYFRLWYGHRMKAHKYINTVLNILQTDMSGFIKSFDYENQQNLSESRLIWICWWQGEESMPPICRSFFEKIKKNVSEGWEVQLITKDNYSEYVKIPPHIIDKHRSGIIKIQQFSDILRQALLYQNGGLWMDITLFTLPGFLRTVKTDLPFWSANLGKIIKNNQIGHILTGCRWSGFLLYGKKGNMINKFVFEGMCCYYMNHDITIDYFIQNYFIRLGYESIVEMRNIIDSIPINNPHLYDLSLCINEPFNNIKWTEITEDTKIYKLTYKISYNEFVNNEPTFYHHIITIR